MDLEMLLKALKNKSDLRERIYAAQHLGMIKAVEAIPNLVEVLKNDSSASLRAAVVAALGEIGEANPVVVEALVDATRDSDFRVQKLADQSLREIAYKNGYKSVRAMKKVTKQEK